MKEGTFLHLLEKSRALWDQYFRRYEFFNLFLFFHIFRIFLRDRYFSSISIFGVTYYVTTEMSSAEGRGREGGRRESEKDWELLYRARVDDEWMPSGDVG